MLPTSGQMPSYLMLVSTASSPAVVGPHAGFGSQAVAEEHQPPQGLKPLTPLRAPSRDDPMSTMYRQSMAKKVAPGQLSRVNRLNHLVASV